MIRIGIIALLLLSSMLSNAQVSDQLVHEAFSRLYGKWEYADHAWYPVSKLDQNQVDSLMNSCLRIEMERAFFEDIQFIDDCNYSKEKVKISKIFDSSNFWEYSWFREGTKLLVRPKDVGPLISKYSKEELSDIVKIELGCDFELNWLYLKQDTLILNYLGGVTFFMTRVPLIKKSYSGNETTTFKVDLKGEEKVMNLEFKTLSSFDHLLVYDENNNVVLDSRENFSEWNNSEGILLNNYSSLRFDVQSQKNDRWDLEIVIY